MKVSIITPAYNCEKFIEKCILSVKNQDYKNIEHIIINDGSKDNTENIIKENKDTCPITLINQENHGIAYTMNKGFNSATGEIFAWLDADNYYNNGTVKDIVEIFEKNPSVDIVYGNIDFVDTAGKIIGTHKPPNNISFKKALIHTTGAIPLQPAVFFKKKIFTDTGGFKTDYRIAGDYEFWLNVLNKNPKLLYIDKIFGSYTLVTSGASQSYKGVINGFKEVYKIAKKYDQPLYGKIILTIKYLKGFAGKLLK